MPYEPPAELEDGLDYETLADGAVRIHMVRDRVEVGYLDCAESNLGFLAASLLNFAAKINHRRTEASKSRVGEEYRGPIVPQSTVSLISDPKESHRLVVLGAGRTEIAFRVPRTALEPLGRALIAAASPALADTPRRT
jgi:hypothetical protein